MNIDHANLISVLQGSLNELNERVQKQTELKEFHEKAFQVARDNLQQLIGAIQGYKNIADAVPGLIIPPAVPAQEKKARSPKGKTARAKSRK